MESSAIVVLHHLLTTLHFLNSEHPKVLIFAKSTEIGTFSDNSFAFAEESPTNPIRRSAREYPVR
jgi:hypothetical protein